MLNKNANNARKSLTLALILATISLALTGCGATGANSPTRNIRQVTDGVEGQSGNIKVRNLLLVPQADGSATLVGFLVNVGADSDAIKSIEVNGIPAVIEPAQNELIQNRPVFFEGDSATAKAKIPGLNMAPGKRVDVVINFVVAAPLKLNALVVDKFGEFENIG